MEEGEGEANTVNSECPVTFVAGAERDVIECQFLYNLS
jgi:hypothetical protein